MKLGLSTSCFKDNPAEEFIVLYEQTKAFSFLEIWDDDGYFAETRRPTSEVANVFAQRGLGICSVHAPFSNWLRSTKEEYFASLKDSFTKAKELGASYVVVHPMVSGEERLESNRDLAEAMPQSFALWREAAELAASFDLNIAFENLAVGKQWPEGCPIEVVMELVHALGMPNVGVCLDLSHCFALQQDVIGVIEKYGGDKLFGIHASDGIYADAADQHLLPEQGELDWAAAFAALRNRGFQGHINLEVKGLEETPEAVRAIFGLLREACEVR